MNNMIRIKKYIEKITDGQVILSNEQLEQFERYYEMLIEKNKVMNLTAITEREEVILKHFIDSLAIAGYVTLWEKPYRVIDIGSGAGFPGIPLKIAFPNLQITLFDSLNKRILFLQEVIDTLCLSKQSECIAIHGRAEEGARNKNMREQYDIAVSRAVANMAVLAEYCLPFVKPGGYFIPYKTETIEEEIRQGEKAIEILGGHVEKTEKLQLPDSDIHRSFVFIKKEKHTPKTYPRKAGTASKQPLGI